MVSAAHQYKATGHWLGGRESEQAPGDKEGQRSLAGYSPWGRKESDTTEVTEHTRMHVAGIPLGWKHFISHSTTERVIS